MNNVAHDTAETTHATTTPKPQSNRWTERHDCSGAENGETPSAEIRRQVAWAMLIERQRAMALDPKPPTAELLECLGTLMTLSLEVETMESELALANDDLVRARQELIEMKRHAS